MTTTSRIEDLRRRVDRDPASIAFAQLAEEHRRNGDYEAAVRVARAGLVHVPGYLSARVTLGRALLELGQVDDARCELESVLATAPDNLAAVRTLAEIHHPSPATHTAGPSAPASADALSGDPAATAGEVVGNAQATAAATADLAPVAAVAPDVFPAEERSSPDAQAAAALERWLAAIIADRAARG